MNYVPIPTYVEQEDEDVYNEEFNQTIRQLLGDDYWVLPSITTAQAATLEPSMPIGAIFFNTDLAKAQLKTADATIETITST